MLNLYQYHTNPEKLLGYDEAKRVASHVFNLTQNLLQKHFNQKFYGEYPVLDLGDFYVAINPVTKNWFISDEDGFPDSEITDIPYQDLVDMLEDTL